MSHTYTKLLVHAVFSTKNRLPTIRPEWQARLHAYLGGILKDLDAHLVRAGGVADHVHLLLEHKPSAALSDLLRTVKASSSKWVHETFPQAKQFAWQVGYNAFSVSRSATDPLLAYIDEQAEHHQKLTFQDEVRSLLVKHGIEYEERYLWD